MTIVFTMRYASKIKKNPRLSVAYESDAYYRNEFSAEAERSFPSPWAISWCF